MKIFVVAAIFLALAVAPAASMADNTSNAYEDAGWSYIAGAGANAAGDVSLVTGLRFQYPRVASLGFEIFAMMPYGFGADLQIAGFSTTRFSLRLLDVGIFYGHEPTNRWVEHDWSLILGGGMEYRFFLRGPGARYAQLTLDYRAFLPDPGSVLMFYGDFGREIYFGALRDGQIILGGGVTF